MRFLSKAAQREMELLVQIFQVQADLVAHLHILEVMPAPFVPGVQIRSVTGQSFYPHLAARARHEFFDLRPSVDGRAIPDHQQTRTRHTQQVLQKLDAV